MTGQLWQKSIVEKLARRDQPLLVFDHIFSQYHKLYQENAQLTASQNALHLQLSTLQSLNQTPGYSIEQLAEINALKDERTELLRTQASNSRQLYELTTSNQAIEKVNKQLLSEMDNLKSSLTHLNIKVSDQTELLKEKDRALFELGDELTVLRLELNQTESKLKSYEKKIKEVTKENANLVERIVAFKHDQATKLNDVNDYVESTLRAKSSLEEQAPSRKSTPPSSNKRTTKIPTQIMKKFGAHQGEIHCIQVNKTGTIIATGGQDKKLNLYDPQTGALKRSLSGSLQGIMSIEFQSDMVLGTSNDHSIKIWGLDTFRIKHSLTGHTNKVYSAKFTDSNKVISGSYDRSIKIWDLRKGYCTKTIYTISSCNDIALLDGEGTMIVSGHIDNNIRCWDTRTGNITKEMIGLHSGQVTSISVSPDQSNHILTTSRDNTLKLIDLRMYETVHTFTHPEFRTGVNYLKSCFSPDGAFVVSGGIDGSLFFWDSYTGNFESIPIDKHSSSIVGVCWSPQGGNLLYSAEREKTVIFWGDSKSI